MEQCRAIITTACFLSLSFGICNALKPAAAFEKQVRFLISLLFVLGLVSPILKLRQEGITILQTPFTQEIQTEKLTETAIASILHETQMRTEQSIRKLLSENEILCGNLNAEIHIDEGQRIYISKVSAECGQVEQACEILRTHLGEEVVLDVTEMAHSENGEG